MFMKGNKVERLFLIALAVFCAAGFFLAGKEAPGSASADPGAYFWPRFLLLLLFLLLLINLICEWIIYNKKKGNVLEKSETERLHKRRQFVGMVLVAWFVILMPVTGFVPDCMLFFAFYGYLLGERRILLLGVRSLAVTLFIYIVFGEILGIALPKSVGMFAKVLGFFDGLLSF